MIIPIHPFTIIWVTRNNRLLLILDDHGVAAPIVITDFSTAHDLLIARLRVLLISQGVFGGCLFVPIGSIPSATHIPLEDPAQRPDFLLHAHKHNHGN